MKTDKGKDKSGMIMSVRMTSRSGDNQVFNEILFSSERELRPHYTYLCSLFGKKCRK